MTTTSEVAIPAKRPLEPPIKAPTRQSRLPWLQLVGIPLALGLLGFNAWWYHRETRPLPDIATISRFMSRDQYAQAEPALLEHLRRSPHDGGARMMLARVYAARNDLLSCARQLHEVPYWWPQKWEALYREGQSYLMIDRARDAEHAWLEVIKDDPLHPVSPEVFHDACQELLKLYATQDRWEDAYPVIWTAYDRAPAPEKLTWLIMRMRAELERVAPKESVAQLRRYAAAAPDDWESLLALARAELALGDRASAERHFKACLQGRPDDLRAWRDYLAALLEAGELEPFLELLGTPPPAAESEPDIWFFRGVASEKAGDWKTAAAHFSKAIELNPFLAKAYYRRAVAEERLGLRDQAIIHRRKSKEINEARGQFPAAYSGYLTSFDSGGSAPATAARRIATICETLGWARAAAAWNRLAMSP
ncbi:MAG: tetratricopeptide repeat protein [Isosphaeraceae bacterium]